MTAGVLLIDRPTDVRNVYVAMSRGTTTNEAFIAITGEQCAADVLAQCIASDWIDQPAHVRQAEINETVLHRPGLLDGAEVRRLLEEKFDIIGFIERAEAPLSGIRRSCRARSEREIPPRNRLANSSRRNLRRRTSTLDGTGHSTIGDMRSRSSMPSATWNKFLVASPALRDSAPRPTRRSRT